MRLFELTSPNNKFYHGSAVPLKLDVVYRARQWKSADQGGVDREVEEYLEQRRPKNMLPRHKVLYMVRAPIDNITKSGGHDDYIYEVQPVARVEKHDLQWLNDLDSVMEKEKSGRFNEKDRQSYSFQLPPILLSEVENTKEMLANKYWSSEVYPYKPWSLMEYLTPSFQVTERVWKSGGGRKSDIAQQVAKEKGIQYTDMPMKGRR